MNSFEALSALFEDNFNKRHFPEHPPTLYDPSQYILQVGGKRVRPVLCLMGNELVNELNPDAMHVAVAIELFHNFTLIHDDIMDKAPLRRGIETVHSKYGEPTALLSGDVMLVTAYEYLNKINTGYLHKVLSIFNTTARQVCEGQQIDMDFEKQSSVTFDDYVKMIELKTSVLLAASLQLGAILGGAGIGNQQHIYEFGKNLGIAFQVQDDFLDAFGDPSKFGKQVGGDIIANKKTFLYIHANEVASAEDKQTMAKLVSSNDTDKVQKMLAIYNNCNVAQWANELKEKYYQKALFHLEAIAVLSKRKKPLEELAGSLLHREF
ncbi:MAG: polyprenyl synthetase family protein [Ginsengibacter sp.]